MFAAGRGAALAVRAVFVGLERSDDLGDTSGLAAVAVLAGFTAFRTAVLLAEGGVFLAVINHL
jgi:hypothetical protein